MVCLLPIFHLENPIREGCELQYNTVNYSLHPSLNNASLPAGLESSIVCLYQVGHLLLQLQHEHPVLAVLVQRVDDELGQVGARAVSVNFS